VKLRGISLGGEGDLARSSALDMNLLVGIGSCSGLGEEAMAGQAKPLSLDDERRGEPDTAGLA